eukprot:TRINITY_DN8466_c1_g1_i3.p2 TRINITY_DN8466_c1_g1~~TRINITY_DN8466_c1_g1_i3.p2  ORF type:complete len:119 (+),score=14.66 TRINITY_DN8466_c1_g1_i3:172-528(+)
MRFLVSVLFALAALLSTIVLAGEIHGHKSCYDAAIANDFSTFGLLVERAGYISVLEDMSYEGVVFIPSNDAFDVALAALGITLTELLRDVELIQQLLDYHIVIDGKRQTEELVDQAYH